MRVIFAYYGLSCAGDDLSGCMDSVEWTGLEWNGGMDWIGMEWNGTPNSAHAQILDLH